MTLAAPVQELLPQKDGTKLKVLVKSKSTKKAPKPSSKPLIKARSPKETPTRLHRKVAKTKVLLKSRLYKKIKRHVLEAYRKKNLNFKRKKIAARRKDANEIDKELASITSKVEQEPIRKPDYEDDLIPTNIENADLSSDLFVSLPQVPSNFGSMSPTEAFLMSFPVVSGSLVSVGKGSSSDQVEASLAASEPITLSGNIFSSKDYYPPATGKGVSSCDLETPKYRPVYTNHSEILSMSNSHENPETQKPAPNTTQPLLLPQQKCFEGITPNTSNVTLLDTHSDVAEKHAPFTFSLTTSTVNGSQIESPSVHDKRRPSKAPTTIINNHYMSPMVVFNTSATPVPTPPIFDGFNPSSFNSFPNSFLGPTPPALPTDCQYGTNAFSFQLTSSNSSSQQPANQLPSSSSPAKRTSRPTEPSQRREKTTRKNHTSVGDKKKEALPPPVIASHNKSHVNWMTDSTRNYNSDAPQQHYPVASMNQTCNSYVPLPPPTTAPSTEVPVNVFRGDDFNQKSDIFFAHPAGEQRFMWNQPMEVAAEKLHRHTDFNIPPLLPPPPPPTAAVVGPAGGPLLPNQGSFGMKQTPSQLSKQNSSVGDQYQPNGNYFSVSNLVGSNKKTTHVGSTPDNNNSSSIKWKASSWEMDFNQAHQSMSINIHSAVASTTSKSYSAEALIGSHQSYTAAGSPVGEPYKSSNKRQIMFSIQDCLNPAVSGGENADSEAHEYNFNHTNVAPPPPSSQFGHDRGNEPKINHQSEQASSFPIFSNDFMQPPLFPPPTLPRLSQPSSGMKGCSKSALNRVGEEEVKRKSQYESGSGTSMIVPSNDQQSNYELTSYFSTAAPSHAHPPPPPPPSFLINSDPFNYSDTCKLPQPYVAAPPLDFNVTSGPANNFSANYLPNFNLSSICPEINNPVD